MLRMSDDAALREQLDNLGIAFEVERPSPAIRRAGNGSN